jgi:lipopolysaccharide export system permease protein
MTILTRYLLRSFFPAFGLCIGVFIFVMLMTYFLRLFNLAVMKGIPLSWILLCFARLSPYFLSLALPMAFLVALLLTLGRVSETGEVMALRASGFSFKDILKPFLVVGIVLAALLLGVNHKWSPDGFHSFQRSYHRALAEITRLDVEPNALTEIGLWTIYAKSVDNRAGRLDGVRVVKRKGGYERMRISAPSGFSEVEKGRGVRLVLEDGSLVWPSDDPRTHTVSRFDRAVFFLPFQGDVRRKAELRELSTPRIREEIARGGLTPQKVREYTTEMAVRSAGALAPFMLFWVACPLGLKLEKRSGPIGFALSLALMFGFYGLLALGVGLGRKSLGFSPWSPWLPNLACIPAGLWSWRRLLKR